MNTLSFTLVIILSVVCDAVSEPETILNNSMESTTTGTWTSAARHFLLKTMPDLVSTRVGHAYNGTIVDPLYRLYRHGPALAGFGFWRSQESVDVCAALTKIEATHWRDNVTRCEQFIYAEFRSYLILFETTIYFFALALVVRAMISIVVARLRQAVSSSLVGERSSVPSQRGGGDLSVSPSTPVKLLRAIVALLARFDNNRELSGRDERNASAGDNNSVAIDDSPYKAYAESIDRGRRRRNLRSDHSPRSSSPSSVVDSETLRPAPRSDSPRPPSGAHRTTTTTFRRTTPIVTRSVSRSSGHSL